eukprot:5593900-Pleurochrysis_carterae.AAC.1
MKQMTTALASTLIRGVPPAVGTARRQRPKRRQQASTRERGRSATASESAASVRARKHLLRERGAAKVRVRVPHAFVRAAGVRRAAAAKTSP